MLSSIIVKRNVREKLIFLFAMIFVIPISFADDNIAAEFDSSPLRGTVDISQFEYGNPVLEGVHKVDIYLNDEWKGRTDVYFKYKGKKTNIAKPCYSMQLINTIGLSTQGLTSDLKQESEQCLALDLLFPGVNAVYDSSLQRILVTAPQMMIDRNARGYVSPDNWDEGIPAATLQYYYNVYGTNGNSKNYDDRLDQFLSFQGGLNIGLWRLHYDGNLSKSKDNSLEFNRSRTYVERAIIPIKSNLLIGESSTADDIFGGINFTGVKLTSDQRMYPDSQRGFAPTVRGVANSTALVKISQRGNLIYEATVPPGPFVINDLYPTGNNGDLLVTVKESDGTERQFTVTYASTAQLLRPGRTDYSLTAGKYRNGTEVSNDANMIVGTISHGINNTVTTYGGGVVTERYNAISGGLAVNTPIGAISADITNAKTKFRHGDTKTGQSVRFAYAKILPITNTNVTLASYRYSSSGYYSPNDAFTMLEEEKKNDINGLSYYNTSRKNRFEVNANQDLGQGYGSLSLNASVQDYWNRSGTDTQYQASYYNNYKLLTYGVNVNRSYNIATKQWDNLVSINLSMPLGSSSYAPVVSANYTQQRDSKSMQTAITGSAGETNQYTYNAYVNRDDTKTDDTTTGGIGGRWAAPLASVGASFSTGNGYNQFGGNISGGIVAYKNGIIFTPMLGETSAIIEAKDAAGVSVANYNGVKLDSFGKAVVPYLNPYRYNEVVLDPKGLSADIELDSTSQRTAPVAGSVVLLKYKTTKGYAILLNVKNSANEPIHFGASILNQDNQNVGYIGQSSQGIVRVNELVGNLKIKWGQNDNETCSVHYNISNNRPLTSNPSQSLREVNAICQ